MFKLKDNTWINPDGVESVYAYGDEVRVRMLGDENESYFYVKVDSPEQAALEVERLAVAIDAGTTRDRLNSLVGAVMDVVDLLRNRL